MFDYSYLKGFIYMKFGNMVNFAKFLGLTRQGLYNKLKNYTSFSQEEILKIQKDCNLSPEEVLKFFFCEKS